ncbi:UNC93-like protein 3 [Phoenix dactylifera]|uniref:UNC93-like protein 3 n=1 Tax=Phoenix dactylifera TaxID=42345 RepID=A0A8B7BYQ4_PHODC|nr:UNC93-like protein 3 [Phoenix dactylifera]
MESEGVGEEAAAPLVVVTEEVGSCSSSEKRQPKNYARDVHILSFAFLFVFSAYGAAQNLESTVNTEEDLGTTSLGILYTSFTLFSVVASPVVRGLGSKRALILGTSGYLLFIASNLKPSWYTMVPASLYLGFAASIIWVGQGTYLTSTARSHAKDCQLHEGTVIGTFNGEFWGMFASHQVIGNLISLALLRDGKEGDSVTGKNLLFTVFLGCMVLGITLMCFLSKRDDKAGCLPMYSSLASVLKSIVAPLLDIRVLLVIPLVAYSGLQQAFVWAEFTKEIVTPALGVSGVGGAMALYGAADAICSLVAGRFTSGLSSITFIVSGGAVLQILVLLWLLFGYSNTGGLLGAVCPLLMAAIWGVGDGVFNTQLNALFGMLFKHDTEAAFAQLKVWQSASIAVIFFLSPYITMQAMLILMGVALCIAMTGFLFLTLHVERSFSSGS